MRNLPWLRRWSAWLLPLCVAPLPACCTMARLFCGPDTSEWVQISFRTHREALATFLEAVRREDKKRIYQCLGTRLKTELGITGRIELDIAYDLLKARVTGLHLLGYAEIKDVRAPGRSRDTVEYELEAEGQRLVATFREYAYWNVAVEETDEDGKRELTDHGGYQPSLRDTVRRFDREQGTLIVLIKSPDLESFSADQLREITTGIEWKLDDLRGLSP